MTDCNDTKISFARDVRPLFRDSDVQDMIDARGLDLSNYDQVNARATRIIRRLELGDMPCDGPGPVRMSTPSGSGSRTANFHRHDVPVKRR